MRYEDEEGAGGEEEEDSEEEGGREARVRREWRRGRNFVLSWRRRRGKM